MKASITLRGVYCTFALITILWGRKKVDNEQYQPVTLFERICTQVTLFVSFDGSRNEPVYYELSAIGHLWAALLTRFKDRNLKICGQFYECPYKCIANVE